MTQDEMEHLIASAGYEPKQRTNLYERLVTREETAELAHKYRAALTPEKRDLAPRGTGGTASALLPVIATT
jgi:2-iminoacetate synthase ThiH